MRTFTVSSGIMRQTEALAAHAPTKTSARAPSFFPFRERDRRNPW